MVSPIVVNDWPTRKLMRIARNSFNKMQRSRNPFTLLKMFHTCEKELNNRGYELYENVWLTIKKER
jgi:hypothetical protein